MGISIRMAFPGSRDAQSVGPQKPLTRADTADVFRLCIEVLAPLSIALPMLWEVPKANRSSQSHLSKDKQSDLVRGTVQAGADRHWCQRYQRPTSHTVA